MPTVADALRRYGPDYLERFGATMPAEHKKVLQAIMACRTGELGGDRPSQCATTTDFSMLKRFFRDACLGLFIDIAPDHMTKYKVHTIRHSIS